jgi:hypothetical protein
MKKLREGHRYELDNFEEGGEFPNQEIQFIETTPVEPGSTELITLFNGTTNEDVIAVLLDRIKYLDGKFPCTENKSAIYHLKEAELALRLRTLRRVRRRVEGKNEL